MDEVKKQIIKFSEERDWEKFHSPENLAKSIAIEAGELLELFQWDNQYDFEDVCDELSDIVNYCIILADKLDVDLETIVLNKLERNRLKYPIDKSKGKSIKYTQIKRIV